MKTKYCYIPKVDDFCVDSRIYAVYVGVSPRELAQLRVLDSIATKNGAFFRPWDQDTDNFLISIGYRFFSPDDGVAGATRRMDFDIADIMKHIQKGDLDIIKVPANITRNRIHMLNTFNPTIHIENHARRAGIQCQSVPRKYLSHREMGALAKSVIGFSLILILFLVSGYLEGIEPIILQY